MLDLSKFFFGEQAPVVTPPVTDGVMADYDAMTNYTDQMMAGGGGGAPAGFLGSLAQMGGQRSFLQPEAPAVSAAFGFAMGPQLYQQEMARQQERNIQAAQLRAEEDKQRQHHQFLTEVEKGRQRMETQKMLVDMKDRKDQFALKRDEFKLKQEEHQLAQEMKQFELDQIIANKDAPKMQVMSDGRVALMFNDGTVQYAGAEEALAFAKDLEGIKQDSYLKQLQAKSFYGGTDGVGGAAGVGSGAPATPSQDGRWNTVENGPTPRQRMTNEMLAHAREYSLKGYGPMDEGELRGLFPIESLPHYIEDLASGEILLPVPGGGFFVVPDNFPVDPKMQAFKHVGGGQLEPLTIPETGETAPAEGEAAPAGTEAAPTEEPLTINGQRVVRDEATGKMGVLTNRGFQEPSVKSRQVAVKGPSSTTYGTKPSYLSIDDAGMTLDIDNWKIIGKNGNEYTPAEGKPVADKVFEDLSGNKVYQVGKRTLDEAGYEAWRQDIIDRHMPEEQKNVPGTVWRRGWGRISIEEDERLRKGKK